MQDVLYSISLLLSMGLLVCIILLLRTNKKAFAELDRESRKARAYRRAYEFEDKQKQIWMIISIRLMQEEDPRLVRFVRDLYGDMTREQIQQTYLNHVENIVRESPEEQAQD